MGIAPDEKADGAQSRWSDAGVEHWSTGDKSPYHSLSSSATNGRRTLVQSANKIQASKVVLASVNVERCVLDDEPLASTFLQDDEVSTRMNFLTDQTFGRQFRGRIV